MSGSFRYIGAIVGGIAGGLLALPTGGLSVYAGISIGLSVGSVLGSVIDAATASRPEDFTPKNLQDLTVTSSALGQFIPIVYGRFPLPGNIIDTTRKQEHIIETTSDTGGGKGGFGGTSTASKTTVYSVTLDIGLCEGPINRIIKVWTDATLVYDAGQISTRFNLVDHDDTPDKIGLRSKDNCTNMYVFVGNETQIASSVFENIHGVGNVPAYRGLAHVVLENLGLGTSGRVPQFMFEVERTGRLDGVPIRGIVTDSYFVLYDNNDYDVAGKTAVAAFALNSLTLLGSYNDRLASRPITTQAFIPGFTSGFPAMVAILCGGDGIEPNTDTVTIVHAGNVGFYASIQLRDSVAIAANRPHNPVDMVGDGAGNLWVGTGYYDTSNHFELLYLHYSSLTALVVATLGNSPRDMLYSPYGRVAGDDGTVYVFRGDGVIERYHVFPSLQTATLIEVFSPFGAANVVVFVASTGVAYSLHQFEGWVTAFNTNADKIRLTIGALGISLGEASDGKLWVGHLRGQLIRMNPDGSDQQSFDDLGTALVSLAPALAGKMWVCARDIDAVFLVDTDGTSTKFTTPVNPQQVSSDTDGNCYVRCRSSRTIVFISADGQTTHQSQSFDSSLPTIINSIAVRADSRMNNLIDVANLDNTPLNLLINNSIAANSIIETLLKAFNFLVVESDGVLKFINKRALSTVSIPEDRLSGGINTQDQKSLVITRTQDRELPTVVTITYPDPARNFQLNAQSEQLLNPNFDTDLNFTVNLPIAIDSNQAQILAESTLYEMWTSREAFAFTLPPSYSFLEPGDSLTITARGIAYTVRIVEWATGDNWLAEVKGVTHDPKVHQGFRPKPAIGSTGFTRIPLAAATSTLLIEPPPLVSTDILPRLYFAPYSTQTSRTFMGSTLFESNDSGVSYFFDLVLKNAATVGVLSTTLGTTNPLVWDDTNTFTVTLYQGSLSIFSDLEVLNGTQWALIGSGNSWELVGIVHAALIGERTYTCSRLLRGRKGSESFVSTHGANEYLVLLSSGLLTNGRIEYGLSRIGASHPYKISDGTIAVTEAIPFNFAPTGTTVKPWAPVLLGVVRNTPSADDITVSFLYRSRLNPELINNSGIHFDSDFTKLFYLYIYTNSSFDTLARILTIDVTALTAESTFSGIYTSAQQVADFGSNQSTIYYGVAGVGIGITGYTSYAQG